MSEQGIMMIQGMDMIRNKAAISRAGRSGTTYNNNYSNQLVKRNHAPDGRKHHDMLDNA